MSRRRSWVASAILLALLVAGASWRLYRMGEEHRRREERDAQELRELRHKFRDLDAPPKERQADPGGVGKRPPGALDGKEN